MTNSFLILALCSIPFYPIVAGYIIRYVFRSIGLHLKRKTSERRKLILARVKADEQNYWSKRDKPQKTEDEDWEQIEGYAVPTAPNGEIPGNDWEGIIGFFHPFAYVRQHPLPFEYTDLPSNAGGGGERVLWGAIAATQKRWPKAICAVYCGDHDITKDALIERVQSRFNITIHSPTIIFLYLSTRDLLLASKYKHFTLLGQSLGSTVVAYDAFSLLVPDIFIDTMGHAFALCLSHFLFPSVPTAAYVHYPTISTDMLDSLSDTTGQRGVNAGTGTGWRGTAKRIYWHLFARLYGWVGGHIDLVMCNGTWTANHISTLWTPYRNRRRRNLPNSTPTILFPPCPVTELLSRIDVSPTSEQSLREPIILYIAQFRPEKKHQLILSAFAKYFHSLPSTTPAAQLPRLVLIGSVRTNTSADVHEVYNLRLQAIELKIRDATTFITDAPFSTILQYLQRSTVGVNGMWNEHFGIGVVEYLAAGCIPVVHDSGGPKLDIVVDDPDSGLPTGFHANTAEEFADGFRRVMDLGGDEKVAMRRRGRDGARRFTGEVFEHGWIACMEEVVGMRVLRERRG